MQQIYTIIALTGKQMHYFKKDNSKKALINTLKAVKQKKRTTHIKTRYSYQYSKKEFATQAFFFFHVPTDYTHQLQLFRQIEFFLVVLFSFSAVCSSHSQLLKRITTH